MVLDQEAIKKRIPHRDPILLVDEVIELDPGKRAVGVKNVTGAEPFFEGHFPGHPVMPGVLIVEALAQTAGLMLCEEGNESLPLFMGIDKARFRRPVVPGDQLRLEVEVLQLRRNVCKAAGKAFVGEELAAEAGLMATLVKPSEI